MKMAARFSVRRPPGTALAADEFAGPRHQRREGDAVLLVRLLHAGDVLRFSRIICGKVCFAASARRRSSRERVDQFVVLVDAEHAVRAQALDGERAGDADLLLVLVGLVVEELELGLRGDRGVDLLLARDARGPPIGVQLLRASGHFGSASRGISHSCQDVFAALFSFSRSGSSVFCHLSQMTSISALLAIDFSVMCGTRS
jgi:hypothetical protein